MKCPNCGSMKSIVIDSRAYPGGRRIRRRKCKKCGDIFWTKEVTIEKMKDKTIYSQKFISKKEEYGKI